MKRIRLDDELYNVLREYAIKQNLLTRNGCPSINRALKKIFLKGALNYKKQRGLKI